MAQFTDRSISFHALNKQDSVPMIFVDGWLSRLHNVESESPSFTLQLFLKNIPSICCKKWKSHKSWTRKQLFLVYTSVARGSPSQKTVAISLKLKTANITSTILLYSQQEKVLCRALHWPFFSLSVLIWIPYWSPKFWRLFFFLNTFNFLPLMSKLTATVVDDCSLLPAGYFSSYFLTSDHKVKIGQTSLQRKSPC